MFAHLVSTYHLHPIVDHFTIALLTFGIAAEMPDVRISDSGGLASDAGVIEAP